MSEITLNGIFDESKEISGKMQYARGVKGDDGVGIQDIVLTGTDLNFDIYTIYLTDNSTRTFRVRNGANGPSGVSVTSVEINALGHLLVALSNGNTIDAGVATGDSGVHIGTTAPTDPNVKVWIDTSGESGDVEMTSNRKTVMPSNPTDNEYLTALAVYKAVNTRVPTGWTKLFDNYTTDTEQDTIIVRDTTRNLSRYTEFIVDIKIPAGGAKGQFKTMIAFANGATTAGIYNNYVLQNLISTYAPNIPNTPLDQTGKICWLTTHIIMFNGRSMIYQATNTNGSYGYPLCFNANTSTPNSLDLQYAYGFIVRVGGRNFPTGTTFSFYAR